MFEMEHKRSLKRDSIGLVLVCSRSTCIASYSVWSIRDMLAIQWNLTIPVTLGATQVGWFKRVATFQGTSLFRSL